MPKPIIRSYSRYALDASALLGARIRTARKRRRLTAQEVAERAGISRGLLQRIETGHPKCEIGSAFEAAAIVGVTLFEADRAELSEQLSHARDKLALLPRSVRRSTGAVQDDF